MYQYVLQEKQQKDGLRRTRGRRTTSPEAASLLAASLEAASLEAASLVAASPAGTSPTQVLKLPANRGSSTVAKVHTPHNKK